MNIYPGSLPFALPLLAIAGLTAGIAHYAFSHQRQPGAIVFGWLTASMTAWNIGYILELLAPTLSGKILAGKLEYIGIASTPVLWFIFALKYTGRLDWLTPNKRLALFALPTLTFVLTLTNEFHHLIYAGTGLDPQGYPTLVILGYGIWFWVHVAFSYSLILAGVALYLIAFFQTQRIFRQQMSVMVFGSIVPLFVNAIRLFTPIPLHGFDLTPFTFAFSGILLSIGLFRYSLIDLIPIAAPLVMENLRDIVIVIDEHKRLMDINSAGRVWLKVGDEAIGRDARKTLTLLEPIWQKWEVDAPPILLTIDEGSQRRWFDISISSVRNRNKNLIGSVIIARDTSREQELLAAERSHARQMEILNSITLASLKTNTLYEMLQTLADNLSELLKADGAFLTLWDEEKQQTIPATAYGEFRETYRDLKIKPDETTLTSCVLREERPIAVEDARNSPYISPRLLTEVPTRSILGLPLIADGEKLGAALISFNQPHHFTAEEIVLGEQAAAQIALALKKNKLIETVFHRATQLELLQEVSRQMSESLNETEICQRTVDAMVDVFGYDEAAISLLVDGDKLEVIAIGGTKDMGLYPGFRQTMEQGIVGHIAETRKQYFSNDITHDPYYYHPSIQAIGSAMGVPMLYEGQLLGVVYVQSALPHTIIPDDIQTMQTLASHLVTAIQKARIYMDAREHLLTMTTLQSVTATVTSSLELDNTFKTVVHLLKETYGYTYVSIYLLEDSTLRLGAQAGYPEKLIIHEIPINTGITGRTVRTRQPQFIPNVKNDSNFLIASYEVESEICVPLLKENIVLGVLNIESDSSRPLTEKDVNLLTSFASPVAMAIDNARLHARVTSLALTDGMTSLFNRRAFDQFLETEITRAQRYNHALSLIMIDMDSFKEFNDTYGHPAGDERLKAIANILFENMRDPDVAARYGGEEFAIILPHTAKEGAIFLAERLREIAEEQAPSKPGANSYIPGYTISLGVATFPYDGITASSLLRAADNAEMNAKHLGKNRVCVCAAQTSENPPNE